MVQIQTQGNYELYKRYVRSAFSEYHQRLDIRMYTELILSSAAIIIFSLFAIKPTLTTVITLYKEMKAKEETIARMDAKIKSLSTAEELFKAHQEDIALLNQAIPDAPHPEIFIRQTEGLAQKHTVTLSNMDLSEAIFKSAGQEQEENVLSTENIAPTDANQEQQQETSIRVTSDYPLLIEFLKDLENMKSPYLFSLPNLTLHETMDSQLLYLEIKGSLIYLPIN